MKQRSYIAIDLKSFYASVECRERGLDPLDTNLVVADESRTDKTICLAVTPSLKAYGISGRARLFEVVQQVKEANRGRLHDAPGHRFSGKSCFLSELNATPGLEIDYLIAPPRMAYYMEYSTRIYSIYLKYIAPEDIIVYSIDEVFMDVSDYLSTYKLTPRELAMKIILDVIENTGITATAGIGTNLYLCKVAMDILAKHIPADENGVRIAELDEMTYRQTMWSHQPLTDFWRVGRGYAKKLEAHGMFTMGDVARMSVCNEDLLYQLSTKKIMGAATALFDRIVNTDLMVRRLNIVAGRVISESEAMTREGEFEQMDLFTDYAAVEARRKQEQAELDRERKMQEVMLTIKKMVPIRTMNYRRIDRTVAGHIRPIRYICTLSL